MVHNVALVLGGGGAAGQAWQIGVIAGLAEAGLDLFDRDSGVDLVDAVTASTALPGLTATHSINGTRYINGGVRSADNVDLASGYANVVVLSPFGGTDRTRQFEGLRRFPGTDLASHVEALRQQGSHVEVITPDAGSRAAMGTNQMDPATRVPPPVPVSPKASKKRPA